MSPTGAAPRPSLVGINVGMQLLRGAAVVGAATVVKGGAVVGTAATGGCGSQMPCGRVAGVSVGETV